MVLQISKAIKVLMANVTLKNTECMHIHHMVGVGPSQARLGLARLASIRGKSSGKARLGAGSKIFGSKVARLEIGSKNLGSQLGSARSELARWLASQT